MRRLGELVLTLLLTPGAATALELRMSTYLGGSGDDGARAVVVDAIGNIYVCGVTASDDYPVRLALQPVRAGGTDAFVTKVDANGSTILFSTYLGGSADDAALDLTVDGAGSVFVAGVTSSPDFPLASPYQPTPPSPVCGFAAQLVPTGASFVYSTYMTAAVRALEIDAAGAAFLLADALVKVAPGGAGEEYRADLTCPPTRTVYNDVHVRGVGAASVAGECSESAFTFAVKTEVTSQGVVMCGNFCNQIGPENSSANAVSRDGALLAGWYDPFAFPQATAWTRLSGAYLDDAFVNGSDLEEFDGVARGAGGRVWAVGFTRSDDIGLESPLQRALGGVEDALLFTNGGISYFGGSGEDAALGVDVPASGAAVIVGRTTSVDLPVLGAMQPTSGGGEDAFLAVVAPSGSYVLGAGLGQPNPNRVRVARSDGTATPVDFHAYAAGAWGVNVAAGSIAATTPGGRLHEDDIVTGPGPGAVYGPNVRGFRSDGTAYGKVQFYAYGTLRYGANVALGDIDGDGLAEIVTGAGPGSVFGPHVRGFDVDGGPVVPMPGASFFAYGTLRYGANVGAADLDASGREELVTAPGPSAAFAPLIRAFGWSGGSVSSVPRVNFWAFPVLQYGGRVTGGDVDADGFHELVASPGPGPGAAFPARVRGFDDDGAGVVPLPGFDAIVAPTSYGARPGTGLVLGVDDLAVGPGPDPAADTAVDTYAYAAGALQPRPVALVAFPGMAYGVNVAPTSP